MSESGIRHMQCLCPSCAEPAPAPESPSVQVTEADRRLASQIMGYIGPPAWDKDEAEALVQALAQRYAAGLADGVENAAQEAETYRGSYVTDIEPHAVIPSHPASAAAVGLQKGAIWIAAAIRALIPSEPGRKP